MADQARNFLAYFLGSERQSPYVAPASEFTTPSDLQRERISGALGWDVGQPGREFMNRLWMLPLAVGVRMPAAPRPIPHGPWSQPAQRARRWGAVEPDFRWSDVPAGRLSRFDFHDPLNRGQLMELAKGIAATGAAAGVGAAGGQYMTDRYYHDLPPEEAAWRALIAGASPRAAARSGPPPSWWPQPSR